MVSSGILLVAAPDKALRDSLQFLLECDGFTVETHVSAMTAFASPRVTEAACAVIDDRAIDEWRSMPGHCRAFAKPIILLVSLFRPVPDLPHVRLVTKPFLGEPLIDAVQKALAGAP